ncbi:AdeC/AdeK/OprM family multidrug efflux complex outer membrane factor [Noviherbaspirillum denitrificans]|uniref:Multidrug transporter n=1 Tax=Noviherbaspirillum denitrificans TaxID=1968433 RepID=A0A254TE54_9BURK|nr:AdeC/AdeK/OprM family multidrug efflux complex outer membrane factor [Noviherbaspirillum denitrificans]OWW18823.1 multidrug transporter [Noviherbaspirillum denitrificans]
MSKQLTLSLLAAAVLSACSMAPTYERPASPVAAAYPTVAEAGDATATGWRNFFPDQRLQSLIAAALENNRDLRIAALRIEEARAQYGVQSADLLPNFNATAGATRSRTPGGVSPTGSPIVSSTYQVGLGLSAFELDFFGRVRSLNDASLAQYLATEEAGRAARISLVAEVAKAYLAERAFDEQYELARKTFESRESAYKLAKQRFDVGASSALDLRQNETLLQSARASLATLTRQRAQASNALALLAGKPLTDLPAAQSLSEQNIVTEIPAGLPSDLLERRPDIRAAEQRLRAANANIGAARAAFFPRISLTAATGTASGDLSGLFESGSRSWSFVPQLVLPIFDAGRNSANLNLAEVRKNVAIAEYEKSIQTAFREAADALAARATLDEQIDAQRAVLEAQAERLKLADLRYRNGVASSLDVLDAQRELFSAEQALVQARLQRLTNAVDLYRALGGGLAETTAK